MAAEVEPEAQRRAAVGRVLDFYLHTSATADRLIAPQRGRVGLESATSEVRPGEISGDQQALEWFVNEHQTLMAAIDHALQHRFDAHAWQLAWTLATYFERHGHWYDWITTQQAAITATTRLADRAAKARAHRLFSRAAIRLGRHEEAATHLRHALDIYREMDKRLDQARTHIVFSWVRELQERYAEAVDHAAQALDLFRTAGHRAGQARALDQLGWEQALLGDLPEALHNCQQALVLFTDLDHRPGLGDTLDSLGYIHHHLGCHSQALDLYEQSIAITQQLGDRYTEATTWSRMGDTYLALDDLANAESTWRTALGLLEDLAHPDAKSVRDKLSRLLGEQQATDRSHS
ncbi:tetratricopeptide repeat protein [Actinokineospora sp. NPDC004072]